MSSVVSVEQLQKRYGELQALKGVSFSLEQGEIFALLGPNGAGKSTCVEILEGHRKATSGSVKVLGQNPADHNLKMKDRIGIVSQSGIADPPFTPKELLEIIGASYSHARSADELLDLVRLTDAAHRRISRLSGGQKRKLDLALGLVGDPELLFLDEPTTGFAPEARREAWQMLSDLRASGTTILLTSHYMEEVSYLADRMAVLVAGEVAHLGKPDDLMSGKDTTKVEFTMPRGWSVAWLEEQTGEQIGRQTDSKAESLPDSEDVTAGEMSVRKVVLETDAPTKLLHRLTGLAQESGVELEGLTVSRSTLEDRYLSLVESKIEGAETTKEAGRSLVAGTTEAAEGSLVGGATEIAERSEITEASS